MSDTLPIWLPNAYQQHGAEIAGERLGWRKIRKRFGLSERKSRRLAAYVREHGSPLSSVQIERHGSGDVLSVKAKSGGQIRTLQQLLAASEVDLSRWRVAKWRTNVWHQASKDADGKTTVTPLHQVKADLEARIIDRTEPIGEWVELPKRPPGATAPACLIVPDSQHGFRWNRNHTRLEPLHDRRALDVVVQVAARLRPERIVLLGDMLDLPSFSTKFPRPMALRDTTTPALRELHWQLAQLRAASPDSRIVYVEGNHEARIRRAMTERLSEASVTVPVGSTEELGSIPSLLGLDGLEIEYVGPYGAGYWLWGQVQIVHGTKLRLSAHLSEVSHSFVMGHIHRVLLQTRAIQTPQGSRTITGICPGCLCRTDGSVPGYPGRPDWSQGYGIAWKLGDSVSLEVREIRDGRTAWEGLSLVGEDHSEAIADAIGYPQAAER